MLQFVCDYCEDVMGPDEVWITGMAAENVGTKAARREVIIDPAWRRDRAVQTFAVHFCSVECKDRYLAELFQKPAALLEIEKVEAVPETGVRVIHAVKKQVTKRTIVRAQKKRISSARIRKR